MSYAPFKPDPMARVKGNKDYLGLTLAKLYSLEPCLEGLFEVLSGLEFPDKPRRDIPLDCKRAYVDNFRANRTFHEDTYVTIAEIFHSNDRHDVQWVLLALQDLPETELEYENFDELLTHVYLEAHDAHVNDKLNVPFPNHVQMKLDAWRTLRVVLTALHVKISLEGSPYVSTPAVPTE